MKKLLFGLMLMSGIASAACIGKVCSDDNGVYLGAGVNFPALTLAQMNVSAPAFVGQMINVSDGVQSKVCIASGTASGAYTVILATAPGAGALQHCS